MTSDRPSFAHIWLIGGLLVVLALGIGYASTASPVPICEAGNTGFVVAWTNTRKTSVKFWLSRSSGVEELPWSEMTCALQPDQRVMILGREKDM